MRKTCFLKILFVVNSLLLLTIFSGCSSSEYKKFAGDEAKQVVSILQKNGCLDCHSFKASLPFYGKFPLIGSTVKADIKEGTNYIDFNSLIDALNNGTTVSEVDVAKLENSALTGSMPPAKYYWMPMHWGKNLNSDEKKVLIDWAKNVRSELFASTTVAEEFAGEPLQPLPACIPTCPDKVALGFSLYHDTRLSGDNTVSCATCHDLNKGGVDRLQFSEGISGQFGGINAPTVYNSALNFVQFWDGRAADLQAQAAGPPLNPVEMGSVSFDDICLTLSQDKEFTAAFNIVYPDGLSEANITDAIAEFEKTLLTPSRFDKYLQGDKNALTAEEIEGYDVFKKNKCATCHVGMNIGGQSYEYFGVKANYFDFRGTGLTDGDNGRFAVTGDESDHHKFKTPTLRNILLTYPYMHDGTILAIEDAIKVMGEYQNGKKLSDKDTGRIVTFLKTLTGEYDGKLLE
jgi:cytochrome c peroxidase